MPYERLELGPAGENVRTNVRVLRTARGLAQADLAVKMSANGRPTRRGVIAHIEIGYRRVDVDTLAAIAQALGVRPEQLLIPYVCERCHGAPPVGFTCRDCGEEA